MTKSDRPFVELNGVAYRRPAEPVVVVCIDGGDPLYNEAGVADGVLPTIGRYMTDGFSTLANGVVPSFTNPNNLSIVTGASPAVHGISGNFFLDPETGDEVMMNDPRLLTAETLFAAFSRAGARVAVVTAKDKLRRLLGHGMTGGICFSSEQADRCTRDEHGIEDALGLVGWDLPDVYSAELSLFAMEAGIRLLERERFDLMYLSLTDYIQHKHAPGSPEANDFYRRLDDAIGRLEACGAVVGLIADHGMSDKADAEGRPNVIYLQDRLDARFGAGAAKVILPITDPYVVHHGALGGFARIYATGAVTVEALITFTHGLPGVAAVFDKATACKTFELPAEREGDVVVVSEGGTALGGAAADHDLTGLEGHRLRSHGGMVEAWVPFILSRPLNETYSARAAAGGIRSYEIFDYAVNGTV